MLSVRHSVLILFILKALAAFSQNCILTGNASDYAGSSIQVSIIDNPINNSVRILDSIHVGMDGNFHIRLEMKEMMFLYFDLGIYRGYMYAEPGNEYRLLLPPFAEPSFSNKINLFYEPVDIHVKVAGIRHQGTQSFFRDTSELNQQISSFDTLFSIANKEVILNRQRRIRTNTDSILNALEERYSMSASRVFRDYRRYRYGLLMINDGRTGLADLVNTYLYDREPQIKDPAYMDLFNAVFDDFLHYYSLTPEGRNVGSIINREHSLDKLRSELGQHPALSSDTLTDLLILKEIYNEYFTGNYVKDALLIILDSLSHHAVDANYRTFAKMMHDEYTRLIIGNPPPDLLLRDQHGQYTSLKQFEGKYIYLFFCTPENYSCMIEYPYLRSYYERHRDYLEIVTVMVSENSSDINSFMEQNQYQWTALHYDDQPGILQTFNISYFPTAFLIGPDGNLIQSPATLPSEGFQQQLFRIMRSRGDI